MSCEICGRNTCTRSFHALEDQSNFDEIADNVKARMKMVLKHKVEKLTDKGQDENECLVSLTEVIGIIDSYD